MPSQVRTALEMPVDNETLDEAEACSEERSQLGNKLLLTGTANDYGCVLSEKPASVVT